MLARVCVKELAYRVADESASTIGDLYRERGQSLEREQVLPTKQPPAGVGGVSQASYRVLDTVCTTFRTSTLWASLATGAR